VTSSTGEWLYSSTQSSKTDAANPALLAKASIAQAKVKTRQARFIRK
jgi:hypothetical protein